MASSASVREFRTPKVNRMQDSPRRSQTLTTSRPEVEINQWQQMQEMETLKLDALMSPRLGRIKAYSSHVSRRNLLKSANSQNRILLRSRQSADKQALAHDPFVQLHKTTFRDSSLFAATRDKKLEAVREQKRVLLTKMARAIEQEKFEKENALNEYFQAFNEAYPKQLLAKHDSKQIRYTTQKRKEFEEMNRAALKIQIFWRGYIHVKQERERYRRVIFVIAKLQRFLRKRFREVVMPRRIHRERKTACIKIQTVWRGVLVRRHCQTLIMQARIQSNLNLFRKMKREMLYDSVYIISKAWIMWKRHRSARILRKLRYKLYIIRIQRAYRSYAKRRRNLKRTKFIKTASSASRNVQPARKSGLKGMPVIKVNKKDEEKAGARKPSASRKREGFSSSRSQTVSLKSPGKKKFRKPCNIPMLKRSFSDSTGLFSQMYDPEITRLSDDVHSSPRAKRHSLPMSLVGVQTRYGSPVGSFQSSSKRSTAPMIEGLNLHLTPMRLSQESLIRESDSDLDTTPINRKGTGNPGALGWLGATMLATRQDVGLLHASTEMKRSRAGSAERSSAAVTSSLEVSAISQYLNRGATTHSSGNIHASQDERGLHIPLQGTGAQIQSVADDSSLDEDDGGKNDKQDLEPFTKPRFMQTTYSQMLKTVSPTDADRNDYQKAKIHGESSTFYEFCRQRRETERKLALQKPTTPRPGGMPPRNYQLANAPTFAMSAQKKTTDENPKLKSPKKPWAKLRDSILTSHRTSARDALRGFKI